MPVNGSVPIHHRSAIERKLQNKNNENGAKRAKNVNCNSAPSSPGALRRNKQPTVEPRYIYFLVVKEQFASACVCVCAHAYKCVCVCIHCKRVCVDI